MRSTRQISAVNEDGRVSIANTSHLIGFAYVGRRITLRLDGHLMHAISEGALIGTWPCPIPGPKLSTLHDARAAVGKLPPPPLPAGSPRAQRRVHYDGKMVINNQRLKVGPRHAGKLVTVIIENTHFRILHGDEELAIKPRRDLSPHHPTPRPRRLEEEQQSTNS